jgi:hypothetical protein
MKPELLEIEEWRGEGYKPVVDFGTWRTAVCNWSDKDLPENVEAMQKHMETDEVFVLLAGSCVLLTADGTDAPGAIEAESMLPLKAYNVKKGTWHGHCMSRDASLLIVENRDTGAANSATAPLSRAQRGLVPDLVRRAQKAR